MGHAELIGYASIVVLNLGWWMQVYQVVKTKRAQDLSLPFLVTATICFVGLQYYNFVIWNEIYIIGNAVGMVGVTVLLLLKLKYQSEDK